MPDLNGLEMARILGPEARIVFTTAFEQYAVDEYKVNALDCLEEGLRQYPGRTEA